MKITKLEIQKKNKSRVNLYVDGTFNCGLSLETIMKNGIKEGQEISQVQLEVLKNQCEQEIALSKATAYIARYQKSESEINSYLRKKEFDEKIVQEVVNKLKSYGFVDDKLFAKNYVKSKTNSQGKIKLAFNLRKKGLKDDVIQETIEEFSQDEQQIENVLEKYLRNKTKDVKTKQKAYRYLASRGYQSGDIMSCLNKFFEE